MKSTNKKKSVLARFITAAMAVFMMAIVFSLTAVSASAEEATAENTVIVAENLSNIELTEENGIISIDNGTAIDAMADSGVNIVPLASTAEDTYETVIDFFVTWFRRIGVIVAFVGAIMFALAIKNNDADQKQAGLLTLVAGFVVAAICGVVDMFVLFT